MNTSYWSDVVPNGESQLTFSYWMNSSESGNQSLINGGNSNEYLFYVTGGGTNLQLFPGGTMPSVSRTCPFPTGGMS